MSVETAINTVVEIDPSRDLRWDQFACRNADATFYHLGAWGRTLEESYGFRAIYLGAQNQLGDLVAALPLFLVRSPLTGTKLVSLPFSDVCGPIGQEQDAVRLLLDHAISLRAQYGAKYLQIRSARGGLESSGPWLTADSRYADFVLRLAKNADDLWSNPALAKVRGHIRKARKTGVSVRLGSSEADLREFYRLHLATTKKHGMPAQSFGYFRTLWRELDGPCILRLLLAVHDGRAVAASLFVAFRDQVHYLYNASDRTMLSMGVNDLVLWEAIEWSCREGYRHFSFGKTSLSNAGLVAFKRGWAAEAVPMYYYYAPRVEGLTSTAYGEDSPKYRLITGVWRRLPGPVTAALGGMLYRHLA